MRIFYRNKSGTKQIDSLESRVEFIDGEMDCNIDAVLLNGEKKNVLSFNNLVDSIKFSSYINVVAKKFNEGELKDENRFSPAMNRDGDLYLNENAILKELGIEVK